MTVSASFLLYSGSLCDDWPTAGKPHTPTVRVNISCFTCTDPDKVTSQGILFVRDPLRKLGRQMRLHLSNTMPVLKMNKWVTGGKVTCPIFQVNATIWASTSGKLITEYFPVLKVKINSKLIFFHLLHWIYLCFYLHGKSKAPLGVLMLLEGSVCFHLLPLVQVCLALVTKELNLTILAPLIPEPPEDFKIFTGK